MSRSLSVLDQELYALPDAARLLRVPISTLRWWLEGRDNHPPVLRTSATGSGTVTWGEFVEAGFLREYRRHRVSLQKLRAFIDALRDSLGVPYPLAHSRPFVGEGRRLLLNAQQGAGLSGHPLVYEPISGQIVLDGRIEEFVQSIDFASPAEGEWAERVHPLGKTSPVVIDPRISFGSPTVKGIRTEALAELVEAGEDPVDVAREYGLDPAAVRSATAYEWQLAA